MTGNEPESAKQPEHDKASFGGFVENLYEGSKTLFTALPRILRILHTLEKHSNILESQAKAIDTSKDRLTKLEGREDMLVAKIEAASLRVTADFAGRLGRVEGRLDAIEARDGDSAAPQPGSRKPKRT